MTDEIVQEHNIAVSRACKIVKLVRSQYYYNSKKNDTVVVDSLQELAFKSHRRSESFLWFSKAICLSEKIRKTMES